MQIDSLSGSVIGVIADAHVHPTQGIELSATVVEALRDVDAVVALGDMGEPAGLDALAKLAPVFAVRGEDDDGKDARVQLKRRALKVGAYTLGAVFDGAKHGLLDGNDPFTPVEGFAAATRSTFGMAIDVLLCAASHKAVTAWADGVLIVNPGSPTLADVRTVAKLHVGTRHVRVEHIGL